MRSVLGSCAFALFLGSGSASAGDGNPDVADPAALTSSRTREVGRRLGVELRTAVAGAFVVRGDEEQADLDRIAETCRLTFEHFRVAMGAEPSEILPPARKGEVGQVEVYQFRREKEYHAFLDKVFDPMRDETVDDRRFALMRRQRGFFVLSPRPTLVQYRGPSEVSTTLSQAAHKTSHVLLLSHRKAGSWMPWWLLEGFAAWQEFGVLRESRVYCIEVERPGDYALPGTPGADEAAKARLESHWRKRLRQLVAGRSTKDLRVLAKAPLNELVLEDVIHAWGVVDWLARDRRLASFVRSYKEKRDFDAVCEAALGAPPAGVEERWREAVLKD
jgi:hypothetical protein